MLIDNNIEGSLKPLTKDKKIVPGAIVTHKNDRQALGMVVSQVKDSRLSHLNIKEIITTYDVFWSVRPNVTPGTMIRSSIEDAIELAVEAGMNIKDAAGVIKTHVYVDLKNMQYANILDRFMINVVNNVLQISYVEGGIMGRVSIISQPINISHTNGSVL